MSLVKSASIIHILPTEDIVRDILSFLTTLENTSVNYDFVFKTMMDLMPDLEHIAYARDLFIQTMQEVVAVSQAEYFSRYMASAFDKILDRMMLYPLWFNNCKSIFVYKGLHQYNITIETTFEFDSNVS